MSPSKRAGNTVDESIEDRERAANGHGPGQLGHNGNGNGHAENGASRRAKPRRRSVVSPADVSVPERGTVSQRGTSSSTITRRSAGRFPEDDASTTTAQPSAPAGTPPLAGTAGPPPPAPVGSDAAVVERAAPFEPPVVSSPPPGARVDPEARRPPTGTDPAVPPRQLPVTVPAGRPAERGSHVLDAPEDVVAPPYVSPTLTAMATHDVAPVPRVLGRRPRVRRVTRVVRHVDPWSVFKIAILFNLVLYGVLLTAGVLLWNVAHATGTVDNLERFFESFGWSEFEFDGGAIYHASWVAGLFGVVGLTGAVVLAATLFNLITDLVGGVRLTVLEEEVVERTVAPMRRFVVRRPSSGADPSAGLRREVDRLPVRDSDDDRRDPA